MSTTPTNLDIAKTYVTAGFSIFPCCHETKSPLNRNGFIGATTDLEQVEKWWSDNPNALIGAPNDQVVVVDIDDYGLSESGRILMGNILRRIDESGLLPENTFKVKTPSGGRHYYFQKDPKAKRRIKNIANIDLLGGGGYVILPDQKSYVCQTSDAPWKAIESLGRLDLDLFESLVEELKPISIGLKTLIQAEKNGVASGNGKKKGKKGKGGKKKSQKALDRQRAYEEAIDDMSHGQNMGTVNLETGAINFHITDGIYALTDKEFEKVDTGKLFLSDGPLKFGTRELTDDLLKELFYNVEIQTKLGEYLGLNVPKPGEKTSIHSIFPGHTDENKSMGVRWNKERSHLLVRDFANFWGDTNNQNDYNIIRLFGVLRYGTNVPRFKGPEATIWFLRLMYEAGILDISEQYRTFEKSLDPLTPKQKKVAEKMILLDALKSLHAKWDETFIFADKFSTAWCDNVSPQTIRTCKERMVKDGYLKVLGDFDCSNGKNQNGFFNTKVYDMIVPGYKSPAVSLNDMGCVDTVHRNDGQQIADENVTVTPPTKKPVTVGGVELKPIGIKGDSKAKATNESSGDDMKVSEAVEYTKFDGKSSQKQKKDVEERYPDLATVVGLVIDDKVHHKIENFLEDFGFGVAPDPENVFIPVVFDYKYIPIEIEAKSTYLMDNFVLEVDSDPDGGDVVFAVGESPSITKLMAKLTEDYPSMVGPEDIETLAIPIATYVEDANALDLDYLTIKFNEYIGRASFSNMSVRYVDKDDVDYLLWGLTPEPD